MKNPQKSERIFLFDVDGVLLDCWPAVHAWLEEYYSRRISPSEFQRMIEEHPVRPVPYEDFFGNALFGALPPKRGMKKLVKSLRKHGYDLGVITAVPPECTDVRRKNLTDVFGDVFIDVHCVGETPKSIFLKEYAARYEEVAFCDDHPENIRKSLGIVTRPIWLLSPQLAPDPGTFGSAKVETVKTAQDIARLLGL